jgi:hypothetical protein
MTTFTLQDPSEIPQEQEKATNEANELVDFFHLINKLPIEYRSDLYQALHRLVEGFERRQQILGYIQESLGQINLDFKYLIFDLEATRRERDEYRRQLELFTQGW